MKKISITVKKNSLINYESQSYLREFLDFFLVPVLNNLPHYFRPLIKMSHTAAFEVIESVTTHKALEILYQNASNHKSKTVVEKIFKKIWFDSNNSISVRNRLKLVTHEITLLLNRLIDKGEDIYILSIASGSARAIIESVRFIKLNNRSKIYATFLDKNPEAINYSKDLVKNLIPNKIQCNWILDTVGNYFKSNESLDRFTMVEMVGLLDYFDDEKTTQTFKSIYRALKTDGALITANISDNKERRFVTNVIGWLMIYRSPEDLVKLLENAGFSYDKMNVYYEPLKIHFVIIARK